MNHSDYCPSNIPPSVCANMPSMDEWYAISLEKQRQVNNPGQVIQTPVSDKYDPLLRSMKDKCSSERV